MMGQGRGDFYLSSLGSEIPTADIRLFPRIRLQLIISARSEATLPKTSSNIYKLVEFMSACVHTQLPPDRRFKFSSGDNGVRLYTFWFFFQPSCLLKTVQIILLLKLSADAIFAGEWFRSSQVNCQLRLCLG